MIEFLILIIFLAILLRAIVVLLGNMKLVTRDYYCGTCQKQHKVELPADLASTHSQFPFAYFYLHGDAKDVLSTLYLDADLKVRGEETQKLDTGFDDIFSKGQMLSIVQNLMGEIERWRADYDDLKKKYEALKE